MFYPRAEYVPAGLTELMLNYEMQNRIPEKISVELRWSEIECRDKYIHMFSMFARHISMESTADITGCLSIDTAIVFKL